MQLLIDAVYLRRLTGPELLPLGGALASEIGMTPMGPPLVVGLDHPWGPSLYQGLMESHFVGNYMRPDTICFDLFSCRSFNLQDALDFLLEHFLIIDVLQVIPVERHSDAFDA